jgi:Ca-activated chloride channel homolog
MHLSHYIPPTLISSLFLAVCLLLNSLPTIQAQQEDDDVIRVESSLIRLNVGVVDRKGRPIIDLTRDDFVIYEDNVKQKIASFEPTTAPFSLALLLDVSGSTTSFRQTIKRAALRFIDALAPHDRVAVFAFNEKIEMLTDFTTDQKRIAWAIQNAEGKGGTALYSALQKAMKELSKEKTYRKAIVVLTDGLDTEMKDADRTATSNADNDEEAIASIKADASPSLNRVLTEAHNQGITIYPLILPSGSVKKLPIPTPSQVGIYTAARVRVQSLADRTGGRLNEINRLEEMARLYAEVAADLRTLYSISYQPTSTTRQRDSQWRTIRIEVNRPDLIARTKPGYFAR